MRRHRKHGELRAAGLALTFVVAMATIGCTTNRMPGTGEPYVSGAPAGPTVPSATRGSSGGTIGRLPATAVPASEDAAAIMAAHHGFQGRVLGPVNPAPSSGRGSTVRSGDFVSPSLIANPQITVNSSISSGPNPAITSGAGEGTGAAVFTGTGGASGITAAAAAAAVTASPTVNLLTTGATPLVGAGLGPGSVPVVGVPVVAAAPAQAASPQISQPLTASGRVRAVTATAAGAGLGATAPPAVAARNRSVRISNTNGMVIISNAGGAESAAFTQRVRATRKP